MQTRQIALPLILLLAAPTAFATDGYFSHGIGVRAQGIGGAGIALPQDGLAAATNPAGTVFLADRVDAGLTLFRPKRDAAITGNGFGANGVYDANGTSNFFIPEFGLIKKTGHSHHGRSGIWQRRDEHALHEKSIRRLRQHR